MNESRILLVDDQSVNLKLLKEMLANQEYTFSFAKNGKKALEVVSTARPDLILLDIMMPEMDGWEVLKRLKKDKLYRDIPVIVQTVLESSPAISEIGIGRISKYSASEGRAGKSR
jgi:CheY-like chemotaxis protein